MALEVLRQFGLVDNEQVDQCLASAFAKSASHSEGLAGWSAEPYYLKRSARCAPVLALSFEREGVCLLYCAGFRIIDVLDLPKRWMDAGARDLGL